MTIKAFTSTNTKAFHNEARELLTALADKHGLSLAPSKAAYSENSVRLTVSFETKTAGGEPARFSGDAKLLGLPTDCYEKTFQVGGHTYTICGILLRNRRYPVLAKRGERTYKFEAGQVRDALAAA